MPACDDIVNAVLDIYSHLKFSPPKGQYTILASFVLTSTGASLTFQRPAGSHKSVIKPISIGTGTKCLPAVKLPIRGEALHDSHAEIVARRGAIRWFFEEIDRIQASSDPAYISNWIRQSEDGNGKYILREDVKLHLYISTAPCGDASTRYLAAFQDEDIAILKDSVVRPPLSSNASARGRDNYSLYGVLRTKPGRADSPPTLSMSCSDKIASWCALGIQGALSSLLFQPLYLDSIIIGEVPEEMWPIVTEDCDRAFHTRLQGFESHLPAYKLHKPDVTFTTVPFVHARPDIKSTGSSSCNESLSWIADGRTSYEVLINGLKRGVPSKHRYREKSRPKICKLSLFELFNEITSGNFSETAYFEVKQLASGYRAAKSALMDENGLFCGWKRSSLERERFDVKGESCR